MKKITIGIPCYNEEENIEAMYYAVKSEMAKNPEYDYEIIFADNDSKDCSQKILERIAANDSRVKVIFNQTNFGPERSGVNCLKNASGDAYIGLPCDFQEPVEMISDFIREWDAGYEVVWGQKTKSKENIMKYFCRKIYYKLIIMMSDVPQFEQVTGFGIMDRKVVDILLYTLLQDPEYNTRNLIGEYGFKIKLIPYTQNERLHGKSSYNMYRYYHFAITSLCNSSIKPLHIMTGLGFVVSVICFIVAIFYLIYKLTHWYTYNAGMAPILVGLFGAIGIQLLCVGIVGEYISILLRRVTNRPLVIEKKKLNFDEK